MIWSSVRCKFLTTFSGSLCPGKYLTFSWSVFMISESLRPFTVSSNTHILTVESNFALFLAFVPTILAIAEPLRTWAKERKLIMWKVACNITILWVNTWVKCNQRLYSHYNLQDLAPKGTFAFRGTGMIVIKAWCVRSDGQSTLGIVRVN